MLVLSSVDKFLFCLVTYDVLSFQKILSLLSADIMAKNNSIKPP